MYHHPTSSEVKKKSTPKRHKLVARIFGGQKFEFPLVLGKPSCRVSVQEIGDLFPEHSYDIPVGFQSKRKFISLRDANQKTFYQCSTFLEQNSLMVNFNSHESIKSYSKTCLVIYGKELIQTCYGCNFLDYFME